VYLNTLLYVTPGNPPKRVERPFVKSGRSVTDDLDMAMAKGIRSRWDRRGLPPAVRALTLITLAGGLSGIFASAFPASREAPVELLRMVGAIALCASLLFWWLGDRTPRWLLQVAVATGTLLISLLIAQSATAVGMIVTACDYMWMGVYAAFFFSRTAARAQTALIAVAFGAALLINGNQVPADAWIFMIASLVVATETIGRQSSRLRREARTDPLTGLLNRKGLAPAAERAFALADRTGIPLTVAIIDLDGFKQVNDREGHAAGDRLLVTMAEVWTDTLDPSDIFARLGGDEFLLLLVGSSDEERARLFERLRFASPTPWSAGVIRRQAGEDLSTCLSKADLALYDAKRGRPAKRGRAPSPAVASAAPQLETT
jgi:diguanylate cyclase (GGDEF)-like protein